MDQQGANATGNGESSAGAPRLTLRFIVSEFVQRFLNLERGWLRTVRELCFDPGEMIRRFVAGRRREYANPVAYLVVATAIGFVVRNALGLREHMLGRVEMAAEFSPAQVAFLEEFTQLVMQNLLYASFTMLIPFALLLRLMYRSSGFNFAEVLVMALYFGGHFALIETVLTPLYLAFGIGPTGSFGIGSGAAVIYGSFVVRGFFKDRWLPAVLRTVSAYVLAYALFMVVLLVATSAYLIVFRLPQLTGSEWNLVTAAESRRPVVVAKLLDEGADPNMAEARTALHAAAENGDAEMVALLLERGADVNARDCLGRVPMLVALAARHREVVAQLAEAGTDATARSENGTTLLMAAAWLKDVELARWAIEGGAEVNALREERARATALMVAADKDDLEMVELLLAHGADPEIRNKDGKTAPDLARSRAVKERLRGQVP